MSNRFMRGFQNMFGGRGDDRRAGAGAGTGTGAAGGDLDLDALLQSVLGGAQNSFDVATQVAMAESLRFQQQPQQQQQATPPASDRAVRNLPLIQIRSADLVDPCNRECCICLEPHKLHETAVRLPCAHIFHRECIVDWLQNHACTCPVCRYELPTDNPEFERHRVERMRHRKPRYARHELERMTIRELKQLLPAMRQQTVEAFVDRNGLIEYLISSGSIDLIAAPEPVEYSMSALRQMSVSQLRRCMNDEAGVFFDPKDVVEKNDMIEIFLASGRLQILPEDGGEEEEATTNTTYSAATLTEPLNPPQEESAADQTTNVPLVETVYDDDSMEHDEAAVDTRLDTTIVMEEHPAPNISPPPALPENQEQDNNNSNKALEEEGTAESSSAFLGVAPTIETFRDQVASTGDGGIGANSINLAESTAFGSAPEEMNLNADDASLPEPEVAESLFEPATILNNDHAACITEPQFMASAPAEEDLVSGDSVHAVGGNVCVTSHAVGLAQPAGMETRGSSSDVSYMEVEYGGEMHQTGSSEASSSGVDPDDDEAVRTCRKRSYPTETASLEEEKKEVSTEPTAVSQLEGLSVSQLRRKGHEMSVDLSDCIERQEMVAKLSHHTQALMSACSRALHDLSASEMLLMASVVGVSCSDGGIGGGRDGLVRAVEEHVRQRPQVASFVQALVPFVRLTVPQLRSVAREWRVNVNHCLEKADILRCLVDSRGGRNGFYPHTL